MDYLPNDSITLTLSSPEGFSDIIMVKGAKKKAKEDPDLGDGKRTSGVTGADGYINIKVTAKNKVTQSEKNVEGEESLVMVRIFTNRQDYEFPAPYDIDKGVYSVNYEWLGIVGEPKDPSTTFEDEQIVIQTITNALRDACNLVETPGKEISILDLIVSSVCPLAPINPVAAAICTAGSGVIITCAVSDVGTAIDLVEKGLRNVVDKVNSLNDLSLPTDAAVSIYSQHKEYGRAAAHQFAISEIINKTSSPDASIVHEYTPKLNLYAISGDGQAGKIKSELSQPVIIQVLANGEATSGANIEWIASSGGTVHPTTSSTASDGTETAIWTLGSTIGEQTLTAKATFGQDENKISSNSVQFKAYIPPCLPAAQMHLLTNDSTKTWWLISEEFTGSSTPYVTARGQTINVTFNINGLVTRDFYYPHAEDSTLVPTGYAKTEPYCEEGPDPLYEANGIVSLTKNKLVILVAAGHLKHTLVSP